MHTAHGTRHTAHGTRHTAHGTLARSATLLLFFSAALGSLAQTLTVTLVPSNYNGYQISCFGLKDGAIQAVVTGGEPPYSYSWSNGSETSSIAELPSGYYRVGVRDESGERIEAEITLFEPSPMKVRAEAFKYPNGENISCYDCYNGQISLLVEAGVPPYQYLWDDGALTQNRSSLGTGTYVVEVRDANSCEALRDKVYISTPQRSDWTMSGNAGTDPANQYIGTSDNKDVVFKSNGAEVLRLTATRNLRLSGPDFGPGPAYIDVNGSLRGGPQPRIVRVPEVPCAPDLGPFEYWRPDGNVFMYPQCDPDMGPTLGSLTPNPLRVITNGQERVYITTTGKVGIGTRPAENAVTGYRLYVADGIATRDVLVKVGSWPDYVFSDAYALMPLPELRNYLTENRHLPGIPTAAEVEEKGGVEVGDLQKRMLETLEQQALYILQLEERLAQMEQRISTLGTSK